MATEDKIGQSLDEIIKSSNKTKATQAAAKSRPAAKVSVARNNKAGRQSRMTNGGNKKVITVARPRASPVVARGGNNRARVAANTSRSTGRVRFIFLPAYSTVPHLASRKLLPVGSSTGGCFTAHSISLALGLILSLCSRPLIPPHERSSAKSQLPQPESLQPKLPAATHDRYASVQVPPPCVSPPS